MQKKINLLSTLLVIAIVLGALSTCSSRAAREGWQEGYEEGYNAGRYRDKSDAFNAGAATGAAAREKLDYRTVILHLIPKQFPGYYETVLNTKTGENEPMSLMDIQVRLNGESSASKWIHGIILGIMIVCILAFIFLLFYLILTIKSGEIFDKGNERTLRWMAVVFFVVFVCDLAYSLLNYSLVKSAIALENYSIELERPSVFPLILGITFLLFAQIFAMGRKMKEDQEFMV
jgi:hypothetical protein